MATREEIYEAIRNADKAGDGKAVAKLAAYLKAMPTAAPKKQEYSAADLAASKFTLGLSDKVAALGTAGGQAVRGAFTGKPGISYDAALASEETAKADYKAANPGIDWATSPLNFFGGGPAGTAIKSATRAGIVSGTAVGAAAGLGNSSGSVGEQIGQVALSSGIGALTGGTVARYAPGVVKGVSSAAAPVVQKVRSAVAPIGSEIAALSGSRAGSVPAPPRPGPTPTPASSPAPASTPTSSPSPSPAPAPARVKVRPTPSRAHEMIADALEADGNTPGQVGRMIADARGRGVPLAIVDTGDNARGLGVGVANAPGASRTVMRDAAISRQEGQTERVQGAINRDLGPTVGVATEAKRLEESAQATAKPLYEKAYASGIVDDPVINALAEHPAMQSALDAGRQIHADDVFMARATGKEPPEALPDGGMDVRTLDYAKRALDRKIDAAYSGDSAAKMQLPFLKDLRSTMLKRLDDINDDYRMARAAYAGPMQSSEALQAGKSAINKSADDIAADTADMSPSEVEQFKLGLRSALSDKIEGQTDGGAKAHALVGTPKKRKVLAQMFGGETGFDNFMATVADEARISATNARVSQGSPTSRNFADDANISDGTSVAASVGMAGVKTALGRPLDALRGLLGDANDRITRKAGEETRAQLAAALSETDPAVLAEALRQARRSQLLASAKARAQRPVVDAVTGASERGAGAVGAALTGNPQR